MQTVALGPVVFPAAALTLTLTVWLAAFVARRLAAPDARLRAENTVWLAAVAGLLTARLGWLAGHAHAYLLAPWAMLDVRDGGWLAPLGWAAAALWLGAAAWRTPALRRPLAAAVLAGALGAGVHGVLTAQPAAPPAVPAVALRPLAGGPAQPLSALLAGRPAVVNLWASWCGPCRAELPALLAARAARPDVVFVLANQRETAAQVQAFWSRQGLAADAPVWLDEAGALAAATGTRGLPTTLIYDASGRLVDAHVGVLSSAALQARLARLRPS